MFSRRARFAQLSKEQRSRTLPLLIEHHRLADRRRLKDVRAWRQLALGHVGVVVQ
jgi:hypothetical protein